MATVKLVLNHSRVLNGGTFPLVFQIIHHRQKKLIYTPFKVFEEELNPKTEKIIQSEVSKRPLKEIRGINAAIAQQRNSILAHIETMENRRGGYNVSDIVTSYKIEHSPQSLLHCIDEQIRRKQEANSKASPVAYQSTRASIATFIGQKEIAIAQVDGVFVRGYVQFLRQRSVSENTIGYYIRNLKAMYHQAVDEGYQTAGEDPFRNLHLKLQKTVKRAVTQDVLRRIAELDLQRKPNLDLARDLFLFSFFARGMSFVDIIHLKKPNHAIQYNRKKTNQWLSVTITPQLERLIKKHENDTEYVFPMLNSDHPKPLYKQYRLALERTNRNLKAVGQMLGLSTTLTTYVARHSWATGAKKTGAPISMISEGLGHTSEKTTQIYLGELDQSVLDTLNKQVTGW